MLVLPILRGTLATVTIAVAGLVATASPAGAHSVSGVGATNFDTRLFRVVPQVEGVRFRVVENGSRVELVNRTGRDLVVLGYSEEPYLRVGPEGVYENVRSPAVYLNASREGGAIPGTADASAEPEWERTGDGDTVRWHDHRSHWMGRQDPPGVRRAPDRVHLVQEWDITILDGDRRIVASGDLRWVPGPSPWPWLAGAALLGLATVGAAASRRWAPALAGAGVVVVVADVVHAFGVGWTKAGGTAERLGQVFGGSAYSVVAWAAGLAGAWMLARRRVDGALAAGFAGAFVGVFGGVVDLTDLSRSQVPFAWGDPLDRALVTVSLGAGLGLVAAAAVAFRRHAPPPEPGLE